MSRPSRSSLFGNTQADRHASTILKAISETTPDQTIVRMMVWSWIQTWSMMPTEPTVAVTQSVTWPGAAERPGVEYAGQQRTGDAADAVHAEDVERVVRAEHLLQAVDTPEAGEAGDAADDQAADQAGTLPQAGGDRDQAGDSAGRRACTIDALPFISVSLMLQVSAAAAVAEKVLTKASTAVLPASSAEAGIEAEPADPQQRGADHSQSSPSAA